jgi:hypothetical protein
VFPEICRPAAGIGLRGTFEGIAASFYMVEKGDGNANNNHGVVYRRIAVFFDKFDRGWV